MEKTENTASAKRSSFSGKIGYVLAAAGSAVGLGNIWRFPYLAAKYGGGSFLVVYLVLTLTFGYTMIMSESALGRLTKKSPVGAFKHFSDSKASKLGGWINAIIPLLIVPYYSVIGGWVFKYLFEYIRGDVQVIASEEYFGNFIGNAGSVVFWFMLFAAATMIIIFAGVENGVEKVSKCMMPILIVLAVIVASYSVTRPGAIEGVKYFFIPNIHNFSWMTVVAALGQMFYSLSIAMGILYTFGSYMKKDFDIEKATGQVELFDTGIAILAGLMIIPAVFAFSGGTPEALGKGPSLMFVTLPQVFASMGAGRGAGIVFFMLVLFAAVTSSVALAESCVSTFQDEFKWSRNKAAVFMLVILFGLGILSCLGFNLLSSVTPLGMDILSFFDFMTNSVMMPIAAAATCLLILRVTKIETVEEEIRQSSEFKRYAIYRFVLKYLAILFLAVILFSSIADALGIIKI